VLNIYRPGSVPPSSLFFSELASVFEVLVLHSCPVVIGGDFNIHVQDVDDSDNRRLQDLVSSFDLTQHVVGPTHRQGNTLDLVLTFAHCPVSAVTVDPAGIISDHSLVICQLPAVVGSTHTTERLVRGWRRVDRAALRRSLEDSELCCLVPADANVDDLFVVYDSVLQDIADRLAREHTVRCRPGRLAPWFDDECRSMKRECRRLERAYRRTHTDADRRRWIDEAHRRFQVYRAKKDDYWLDRLQQHGRSSPLLWRSLSSALGRDRATTGATGHTAEGFAAFFARKVDDVMASTAGLPSPSISTTASATLSVFRPCAQADIRRIVMKSPVKSCSLDPVPTFLVREFIDVLLPYITAMVNASLKQGRLPESQKHAIVTPLLKKPGLDTAELANYRPVSNLTFMSKIVERAVAQQLNEFLESNSLLPCCQSAYRKQHSTETAMLRIWSDVLTAADTRHVTLLGLLDLTAAFDCVDHDLLLLRLERKFGLTGSVLEWTRSFLVGRTQQVAYNGKLSPVQSVKYGVPQGSVLGPLVFVLYTTELHQIVADHGLKLHQYADDCQVYVASLADDAVSAAEAVAGCIDDINTWLSVNRLRLNPTKTQIIWLGSKQRLLKIPVNGLVMGSTTIKAVDTVRDLGVIVDSQLTMSAHVKKLCQTCYYQLRQLRPIARSLTGDTAKTLVHSFIACRLDYCNSLLYGMSDALFKRLQSVQNAAARLVTGTRRRDHITPVLRRLHWLPVRQRVDYKLAILMHKAHNGRLPSYLGDDCCLVADTGRRRLRSSDAAVCVVPRSHTNMGDRGFSVAGPRIWNSLPTLLRSSDSSYDTFKKSLKTFLFAKAGAHS